VPAPEVVQALGTRFGATPFSLGVELPHDSLLEAARSLRDVHGYRYYVLGTATEREGTFEVLHGLRNVEAGDTLFVKVAVPKDAAEVDSLAFVFAGAEWQEREIWDLFGVAFRAHPDPRRILLPDEYTGHPLRKDFAMDTPWGYRPATGPAAEPGS
jgi:NADH-quinone oxidoreductase subunit C